MEEKIIALTPPVILNPKEGDKIDTLILEGTGKAGAAILMESNFLDGHESPWIKKTEVKSDGHWQYPVIDKGAEIPRELWFRAKQEQYWPPEMSEPSEKVFFTKLLALPVITKPIAGDSLHQHEQMIKGTGLYINTNIEIELTKTTPPALTYHTTTNTDGAGWWEATPKWSLMPGPYVLKCRQIFKEHTSRWSDDLLVTVE
ncbi:hypothetical protein [Pseudomonas helvetica]|uniref:hypothetical protein n=1 Tax=Pseudomonas helvetica TaxID=3136738 RepID=UPI0032664375